MNAGRIVVARLKKKKNNFLRYLARLLISSGSVKERGD